MNVIRCKNGHFFDGDSYNTCPHCGEIAVSGGAAAPAKEEKKGFWGRSKKEKGADIQPVSRTPAYNPNNDFGSGNTPTDVLEKGKSENSSASPLKKDSTLDFWQTPSHSDSRAELDNASDNTVDQNDIMIKEKIDDNAADSTQVSEERKQEKANDDSGKLASNEQSASLREAVKKSSASNEGKTMSYFSTATNPTTNQARSRAVVEPVVGWLVCIGGCHFGECFNICAGKNSIGRSEENRIVISDDTGISRIKHALIVYEPKKRNFYLQPGDSSGLTYLNEDYITDSKKLTPNDVIELGDSKFLFVPLCGEAFSWEDYMAKGE